MKRPSVPIYGRYIDNKRFYMEIVLIRHGKPTGATNPRLSAAGFAHWVRGYNRSKVDVSSPPPTALGDALETHFIVSSDLPRAIDSACLSMNKKPDIALKQFREMDIPRFKLPFSLTAYTWLFISRLLWFVGFSGKVESFKQAKERAKISAAELLVLANTHGKVAFFGHGMLNKYIAKELQQQGWGGVSKGKKYWSIIKLTKQ